MEQTIGSFSKTELLLTKFACIAVACFVTIVCLHIVYERFFSVYELTRRSAYNVTQVQCGYKLTGFQIAPNGQLQMTVQPLQKDEKLSEYRVEFNKKGETKNIPNDFFEKRCE